MPTKSSLTAAVVQAPQPAIEIDRLDDMIVPQVGQATGRLPLWLNVWVLAGASSRITDTRDDFTATQRNWLLQAALAAELA